MEGVTNFIEMEMGISAPIQIQIFKSFIMILIMVAIYNFIKRLLYRSIKSSKVYYKTKKALQYVFILITTIIIARIWISGVATLTTFIGLLSAGIAITMRDLIMNVAGWAYIVYKGPFNVGHRIEVDNIKGDVIDLGLFEFALMETNAWVKADQSTGRIVYLPNSYVFRMPVFNYSTGIPFIWNEIPIYITYESNWQKAKKILEEIANNHGETISEKAESSIKEASKKYMLFNAVLEPSVYLSLDEEKSIALTIRYMCSYRKRRESSQAIYEEVLIAFSKHSDIEFSYPTQRVYDRQREVKTSF